MGAPRVLGVGQRLWVPLPAAAACIIQHPESWLSAAALASNRPPCPLPPDLQQHAVPAVANGWAVAAAESSAIAGEAAKQPQQLGEPCST